MISHKVAKKVFLSFLFVCPFFVAFAQSLEHEAALNINWWQLSTGLFAGLALFLFGMDEMSKALNKCAGNKMRTIMGLLTKNKFVAFFIGIFVTVVVQSSSATTVMLVTFVQSGIMDFMNSLAIILGASVGTTVTAQLVAFQMQYFAYFMIALGFTVSFFSKKRDIVRYTGQFVFSFGILFVGMKLMSSSMTPLRTYPEFVDMLKELESPILGVLFAALFTALIQSSAAFLGIIFALANQDLISLSAGIPLVIGTNIGTCITAVLSSIGTSREAKRVAIAHIMFKVVGALIFIWWIPQFSLLVSKFSNYFNVTSKARFIANAHTIYNVGLAFLFFPFIKVFGKLVIKMCPTREVATDIPKIETKHLDESLLSSPVVALDIARAEIARMTQNIRIMLSSSILPIVTDEHHTDVEYNSLSLVDGILFREKKIDYLERKVKKYLITLCQESLSDDQAEEAHVLLNVAQDLESIADIISKGIVPQIHKKKNSQVTFSIEGLEEISMIHNRSCKQIARLHGVLRVLDPQKAERIISKMEGYMTLESDFKTSHMERLSESREETILTHDIHTSLMDSFKRINVYTGDIAKTLTHLAN